MTNKKQPPERIYLQWFEDYTDEPRDEFDVTWSDEPVNDNDVEYKIVKKRERK